MIQKVTHMLLKTKKFSYANKMSNFNLTTLRKLLSMIYHRTTISNIIRVIDLITSSTTGLYSMSTSAFPSVL